MTKNIKWADKLQCDITGEPIRNYYTLLITYDDVIKNGTSSKYYKGCKDTELIKAMDKLVESKLLEE